MFDINVPVVVIFFIGLSLTFALCAITIYEVLHLKTVKQVEENKKKQNKFIKHDFRKRNVA